MISCTTTKNVKHSKAIVLEDTDHAFAKVGSMQEGFNLSIQVSTHLLTTYSRTDRTAAGNTGLAKVAVQC
jgi:hypothetical protein